MAARGPRPCDRRPPGSTPPPRPGPSPERSCDPPRGSLRLELQSRPPRLPDRAQRHRRGDADFDPAIGDRAAQCLRGDPDRAPRTWVHHRVSPDDAQRHRRRDADPIIRIPCRVDEPRRSSRRSIPGELTGRAPPLRPARRGGVPGPAGRIVGPIGLNSRFRIHSATTPAERITTATQRRRFAARRRIGSPDMASPRFDDLRAGRPPVPWST